MKADECRYKTHVKQHEGELAAFIDILKRENVRSYLEIGSKFGGSLWRVALALPNGSRIVSVDLPYGDKETQPALESCVRNLCLKGYDAHCYLGDSTSPEAIEYAGFLGPYDVVFIDANHTLPFVTEDWNNYGPMARIVAFHDIGWLPRPPPSKKMPIDVPELWNSIKGGYRHEEIKMCDRDNGFGILWR